MKKEIKIYRVSESLKATRGVLVDNEGEPICVTLENPWRHNEPFVSCIPCGKYECEMVDSPKFGEVYEVKDVPDRYSILFHILNYESQTHGCIGLGTKFGKKGSDPAIWQSGVSFKYFYNYMKKEPFTLNIING